ncbi:MAG: radical SAM protein, partial [Oscillospiraceae bacterium]
MNYRIMTLGCKVNQFETQALETMLQNRGFMPAGHDEKADVIIVNTCAVTAESGRKSRQAIRKLAGENPGALVAVCGCYSQLSPSEIDELGADVIHGSGEKERLADDIEKAVVNKHRIEWTDDPFARRIMEELPSGAAEGRTRAMLKIQDGCTNFCSYCIIPYTRGRVRSLPPERCAAQSEALAAQGFRELVITGIEIASYGRDLTPKQSLADAIEAIAEKAGEMRIRLGSLEPTVVTEDFCARLKKTGKLCDHFHLSL